MSEFLEDEDILINLLHNIVHGAVVDARAGDSFDAEQGELSAVAFLDAAGLLELTRWKPVARPKMTNAPPPTETSGRPLRRRGLGDSQENFVRPWARAS